MASGNMVTTFVAHPSVRMKGTEDNWHPVHCSDVACDVQGQVHMHCPMCTRDSHYTDPVILKAHYRVKHVDKGVEFAGLKVMRCCRSCEIIGVISGYKNFKGPHWHCYRCRNGFNRKDEALKHYKTHFKNPQTTFQIQLVQDINHSLLMDSQQPTSNPGTGMVTTLTTPTTVTLPSLGGQHTQVAAGGRLITVTSQQQETAMATNGISVAANETIDSNTDTIVLIENADGSMTPSMHSLHAGGAFPALIQAGGSSSGIQPTSESNISKANLLLVQEKMKLEQQLEQLQRSMGEMEHKNKIEIQRLKARVEQLSMANSNLKQVVDSLRKASSKHLPDRDEAELEQLVKHMEDQHSQLLRHHVAQLNLFWNTQQPSALEPHELQENIVTSPQNVHNAVVAAAQPQQQRVHIIPMATAEALERMVTESNANSQNPNTLSLSRDVTMETAEGSYQVTLLPEVTPTVVESAAADVDLEEDDSAETGRASEMTTLSSVAISYSDDRTDESSATGGAGDSVNTEQTTLVMLNDSRQSDEDEDGSNTLAEYQNGNLEVEEERVAQKRSAQGSQAEKRRVNKKIRDR